MQRALRVSIAAYLPIAHFRLLADYASGSLPEAELGVRSL